MTDGNRHRRYSPRTGPPGADGFVRIDVDAATWTGARRGLRCRAARSRRAVVRRRARPHGAVGAGAYRCARSSRSPSRDGALSAVGQLHAPAIRLERAMRDLHGVDARRVCPMTRPWLDHGAWPTPPPTRRGKPDAAPRAPIASCRSRARACTRSRSDPCTPASSSPATSASPPTARPSCGSRNGSATSTRASRRCDRRRHRARRPASLRASPATAPSPTVSPSRWRSRRRSAGQPPPRAVAAARHHGRAGAPVAPRQRRRRDLQRRQRRRDPGALHAVARGHPADGCRVLRPSPDDGSHRARRCRGRSRQRTARPRSARCWSRLDARLRDCRAHLRHDALAAGPHGDDGLSSTPRSRANSLPAASSGAHRAAHSTRAPPIPMRPTTASRSRCPVRTAGDVDARVWIRIEEVAQSIADHPRSCRHAARAAPSAARRRPCGRRGRRPGRGVPRRSSSSRCGSTTTAAWRTLHARDASWFQWPLLEAAIEGNIVADFPLCNKSFNCSYSGHDHLRRAPCARCCSMRC